MNWINFFFYVIVLNSLTGTVAYLLCKLLALVAKKYNAIRIIYPLYRLVLLFYIVPLGYIYIRCKCFVRFGANTLGDGFLGNQVIYEVMQCCLLIWFSGMLCVGLHYLKKWKKYRWICRKNIPFHGEEYRAVLQKLYPGKNWKKVRFCTNYTIDSPCVMGVFHHVIVFKALNYPMKDIELVLMHEGTHIVRRDNLGKKLALLIVLVNWFNPILRLYLDDLDAWGDISCDIHVCSHFLGGHARKYFDLAIVVSLFMYIAFILISAVGTILAVQSLSDSTKYKYRYLTLRRLGINDKSLFKTIRKQLLILFCVPAISAILCSFVMMSSLNNVYQQILGDKHLYLMYFGLNLIIFFLIYSIYWIATYIGFKRNINEAS